MPDFGEYVGEVAPDRVRATETGLVIAPEGVFPEGFPEQIAPPGSAELLTRGRALAQEAIPLQIGNLFESIAQLRARAAGSSAEILPGIINQLSQLRSQYSGASQAISRRLGFAGGGQTVRDQGQALAQATRQYGGLITQQQQAGVAGLINTLSGFQPQLSGAARPASVSTRAGGPTPGVNLAPYGQALGSLVGTARQIAAYYGNSDAANAARTIEAFRQNPAYTTGLPESSAYPYSPGFDAGTTGAGVFDYSGAAGASTASNPNLEVLF